MMTCFGSVLNEMIEEMGDFLKDKIGFDEICHLALPMQVLATIAVFETEIDILVPTIAAV